MEGCFPAAGRERSRIPGACHNFTGASALPSRMGRPPAIPSLPPRSAQAGRAVGPPCAVEPQRGGTSPENVPPAPAKPHRDRSSPQDQASRSLPPVSPAPTSALRAQKGRPSGAARRQRPCPTGKPPALRRRFPLERSASAPTPARHAAHSTVAGLFCRRPPAGTVRIALGAHRGPGGVLDNRESPPYSAAQPCVPVRRLREAGPSPFP